MEVFILKFKAIAQYQIPELFKHCQPSPSDPGVMRQLLPPAHPMEMCYQWRGEFSGVFFFLRTNEPARRYVTGGGGGGGVRRHNRTCLRVPYI